MFSCWPLKEAKELGWARGRTTEKQAKCSLSDTAFKIVGITVKRKKLSLIYLSKVLREFYGLEQNCQISGKLRFGEIDTSFLYNVN